MRPGQRKRERGLSAPAWITHKPLIPEACTAVSAPCSLSRGLASGMLHPQLTTILSPNTPQRLFPPLIVLSLTSSVFSPALTSRSRQATCVTRGSGKKKVSKPIGTRAPNLFLESVLFFFENKKATGRNRQYEGEGGLFLIWSGLPPVLPRQRHNHSSTGREGGSD